MKIPNKFTKGRLRLWRIQTKQPGLYSEQFEHDNCGIGAIVSIKGIKTHQTVSDVIKYCWKLRAQSR